MDCKERKKDVDSCMPTPKDIITDKEMFAAWGPKCSAHGFNYKFNQSWAKEIEDVYSMVYGLNKIPNNTISESFARSFVAHKKGYYVNWAEFRAKLEQYRISRWGRRKPPSAKPKNTQLRRSFRGKKCAANSNGDHVIDEMISEIEIHKHLKLKAGYEEKLEQARHLFHSYSSLLNRVNEAIVNCKSHIEPLMSILKEHEEIGKNQENLYAEMEGFQNLLKANTLIEEICTTRMNAKAADVNKIQKQIAEVDTAIAELQRKHLAISISPRTLPLQLPLHRPVQEKTMPQCTAVIKC